MFGLQSLMPEALKRRMAVFLLQRTLGRFLDAELDDANLDLQLGDGVVVLRNLNINIKHANDLCDTLSLPFHVVKGTVREITTSIPWKDLWSGNCSLVLDGLCLDIENRSLESKSSSETDSETPQLLASSIHFAGDFLKRDLDDDELLFNLASDSAIPSSAGGSHGNGMDGLQTLAGLLDQILSSCSFRAVNTEIKITDTLTKNAGSMGILLSLELLEYGSGDIEANGTNGLGISEVLPETTTKVINFGGLAARIWDKQKNKIVGEILNCSSEDRNTILIQATNVVEATTSPSVYTNSTENTSKTFNSAENEASWNLTISIDSIVSTLSISQINDLFAILSSFNKLSSDKNPSYTESSTPSPSPETSVRLANINITLNEITVYLITSQNSWSLDQFKSSTSMPEHIRLCISNTKILFDVFSDPVYNSQIIFETSSCNLSVWLPFFTNDSELDNHIPTNKYINLVQIASDVLSPIQLRDYYNQCRNSRGIFRMLHGKMFLSENVPDISISPGLRIEINNDLMIKKGSPNYGVFLRYLNCIVDLRILELISAKISQFNFPKKENVSAKNDSELDLKIDLKVSHARFWIIIPDPTRSHTSLISTQNILVLDASTCHLAYSTSKYIQRPFEICVDSLGLSLAIPDIPWNLYSLTPIVFISGKQVGQSGVRLSPIKSMANSTILNYSKREIDRQPSPESEYSEFDVQSWYDVEEFPEDQPNQVPENSSTKKSYIEQDLLNCKSSMVIELCECFLNFSKREFDQVQLLINYLSAWQMNRNHVLATDIDDKAMDDSEGNLLHKFGLKVAANLLVFNIRLLDKNQNYYLELGDSSLACLIGYNNENINHFTANCGALIAKEGETVLLVPTNVTTQMDRNISSIIVISMDPITLLNEMTVTLDVSDLTIHLPISNHISSQLKDFFKAPDDLIVLEEVERLLKISISFSNLDVKYKSENNPFALSLFTEKIKSRFNIIPSSPTLLVTASIQNSTVGLRKVNENTLSSPTSENHVKIISSDRIEVNFRLNQSDPKIEVELSNNDLIFESCPDSFASFIDIIQFIGRQEDSAQVNSATSNERKSYGSNQENSINLDMLSNIELDAFKKDISNIAELKPDDVHIETDVMENDGIFIVKGKSDFVLAASEDEHIKVYCDFETNALKPSHFSLVGTSMNIERDIFQNLIPVFVFRGKDLNIDFKIHEGYDWIDNISSWSSSHSPVLNQLNSDETENDIDVNFDAFDKSENESQASSSQTKQRSENSIIDIKAFKLNIEFDAYSDDSPAASKLKICLRELEIIDNVRTSQWKKFLSSLRSYENDFCRETESDVLTIDLSAVRPIMEDCKTQELRLNINVLPLRLFVDQDTFLTLNDFFKFKSKESTQPNTPNQSEQNDEAFFQLCHISAVDMKIDYKPKHVDYGNIKDGNILEMLNFFALDCSDLRLSELHLAGIKGWGKLITLVVSKWLPFVRQTQVPRFLAGVSGVRSMVNISTGLTDLFILPLNQYQKDGRILKGLQRGAKSFAKITTLEALKLGSKFASGAQRILENADAIISNTDSSNSKKLTERPRDIGEGAAMAIKSFKDNIGSAANVIRSRDQAIITAVPSALLKPIIGATEAASKTLIGIQNSIDPDKRREMEDKYRTKEKK